MGVVFRGTCAAFVLGWIFRGPGMALICALMAGFVLLGFAMCLSARRRRVLDFLNPKNLEHRPDFGESAMPDEETHHFDVVIMGGGIVGLIQALHLCRRLPSWARIAIVEPKTDFNDHKWGESCIEISTTLFTKHLGLHNYLLENNAVKHGLFYHWPKTHKKSATMGDYYSIWGMKEPSTVSFQLNRRKVERDFTDFAREAGVTFFQGRATKIQIKDGCGHSPKTLTVKLANRSKVKLSARHLVDASGRTFLLGRLKNNLLQGPQNTFGTVQGAVFMRVVGVDRKIFDEGYHPRAGTHSRYYATNHFFGTGHWVWMIPISPKSRDLSIGVVYHPGLVDSASLNSKEKMISFLEQHQQVLARLVKSADTIVDFKHIAAPLGHSSKTYLSPDGWYVIGEAAVNWDPLYSVGLAMAAVQVTTVTECIRQELCGRDAVPAPILARRLVAWNEAVHGECFGNGAIFWRHLHHLGHCSAMSWRIYMENILYFASQWPSFVGQYHVYHDLDNPLSMAHYDEGTPFLACMDYVYDVLDEMVAQRKNAGIMHTYLPGELTMFGTGLDPLGMCPTSGILTGGWLFNAQVEPLRLNLAKCLAWALVHCIFVMCELSYRVRGWRFVFNKKLVLHVLAVAFAVCKAFLVAFVHDLETWNIPSNNEWSNVKEHMRKNYEYDPTQHRRMTGNEQKKSEKVE